MLTKVIEQSKIDHFTKWFDRADKIVIVSHVGPDGDVHRLFLWACGTSSARRERRRMLLCRMLSPTS